MHREYRQIIIAQTTESKKNKGMMCSGKKVAQDTNSVTESNYAGHGSFFSFISFLVSYVGERLWWPIQCLNKGRKKKAKC